MWVAATLVALGTDVDANSQVVLAALKDKSPQAKTARGTAVEAAEFLGPKGKAGGPGPGGRAPGQGPAGPGPREGGPLTGQADGDGGDPPV